jgi:hypothetical protein
LLIPSCRRGPFFGLGGGLVDCSLAAEFFAGGIVGCILGMRLVTRLSGGRNALNRLFGPDADCRRVDDLPELADLRGLIDWPANSAAI